MWQLHPRELLRYKEWQVWAFNISSILLGWAINPSLMKLLTTSSVYYLQLLGPVFWKDTLMMSFLNQIFVAVKKKVWNSRVANVRIYKQHVNIVLKTCEFILERIIWNS